MKRGLFLLLPFLVIFITDCLNRPRGISANEMLVIINFDQDIELSVKEYDSDLTSTYGNLIMGWEYSNKEAMHTYAVALFEGGTLWREKRDSIKKRLMERPNNTDPDTPNPILTTDGRFIYFMGMGYGPGGSCYGGFSTLPGGKHDLLITVLEDFGDDLDPAYRRFRNPPLPQRRLPEIYSLIEKRIIQQVY